MSKSIGWISPLGEEHPFVLLSMYELAENYSLQEKYGVAETLFEKVFSLQSRILGETHPDTLITLNNFAGLYYEQKKYTQDILDKFKSIIADLHKS